MRITYLNVSGQMGGAETSLLELLKKVQTAHPDWQLNLVVGADGPFASRVKGLGIPTHVVKFPPEISGIGDSAVAGKSGPSNQKWRTITNGFAAVLKTRSYLWKLSTVLGELEPQLIHSTGFKMHLLSFWTRPSSVPVVWHIHDYVSSRPLMRTLLKWHANKCAAILVNSNSVREDVLKSLSCRGEVIPVYNELDLETFSPAGTTIDLDAASGLPPAPAGFLKIGLLSTFAKWKGHSLFLQALAMLPPTTAVRAYIIGGPIYQTAGSQFTLAELQAEVQRLGLSNRVGFTGFLYPPDSALRSLDVVVHASTQPEPFGMVIVEAMACGKPVIASDQSGACELFSTGRDLLSYPCNSADKLSEQIQFLVEHPEQRCRIGKNARSSVQRILGGSRLSSELTAVYARATSSKHEENFATN